MRDKINIIHTHDENETTLFIETIRKKIEKQGLTFLDSKLIIKTIFLIQPK